jgi:L-threonylcarbamoyladenylate synthase
MKMCKIIKKNFFNINKTVNLLKHDCVGIIPTDTVYGLSGIVDSSEEKIKLIKGRDENKPFIQLIGKPEDLNQYTDDHIPDGLLDFWPGALSIIVNNKFTKKTTAFRCPGDKWLRNIIIKTGKPLYSTSVNRSGKALMKSVKEMYDEFHNDIDFIVDNGIMDAKPSTIIDISCGYVKVIRQGEIIIPEVFLKHDF